MSARRVARWGVIVSEEWRRRGGEEALEEKGSRRWEKRWSRSGGDGTVVENMGWRIWGGEEGVEKKEQVKKGRRRGGRG